MDREQFRQRLAESGFDEPTLAATETGTICGPRTTEDEDPRQLPVLVGGQDSELVLGEQLARGGMGLVYVARQRPLGRSVAVKAAVRGSRERHEVGAELIREGRVTGALEHPNIVPVHALGRNAEGDVLLVMKRIEGTSWAAMLRDRPAFDHELDRHLEIFMDVCQTVHFAHSRGVIHRDIKPENVMVGSFGEVYLLDWGLAVATGAHSVPGVTPVGAHQPMAGTPHYMAPEMAVPDGVLDERTDTFLLGSTLHAILKGHGPNRGTTVFEVMFNAMECRPPALGEAPPELAAICRRALERDPAARYATAEELRRAIAAFRRNATARDLCTRARTRLRELQRIVSDRVTDDLAAHQAYSAARFGFAAALEVSPGFSDALAGQIDVIHAMIEYELARMHLDAARVLERELPYPVAELADRIAALAGELAAEEERRAADKEAARNFDVTTNQRPRNAIVWLGSIAWAGFALTGGTLIRNHVWSPLWWQLALANLSFAPLVLVLWRVLSRRGPVSRADAAIMESGLLAVSGAAIAWLIAGLTGAPFAVGIASAQLAAGLAFWSVLRFVDRRFPFGPFLIVVGVVPVVLFERWALDLNGMFVSIGLLLSGLRLWSRP